MNSITLLTVPWERGFSPLNTAVRNDLLSERERLQQLQTDFEYNLSLLEQRDKELSRYDTAFSEVKSVVNSLVAENSELKVITESFLLSSTMLEGYAQL